MNELVATLLAPLSRFPCSPSLLSDCVSLSQAFHPGLSLHFLGFTKAGEVSRMGLVGQGAIETQVEAGESLRDNGLVTMTSPLSQQLTLSSKTQGQLWGSEPGSQLGLSIQQSCAS